MRELNDSSTPIQAVYYAPGYKSCWDEFIRQSKNGLFLMCRDYVEYHADRFCDFSLLFYRGSRLLGVMPANRDGDTVVSHAGLTFGGVITDAGMTTKVMLDVFSALLGALRARGVKKLIYKAIPHIYHTVPAEEDLYALFLNRARLFRRDISSTLVSRQRLPLSTNRTRILARAKSHGLIVEREHDFSPFMAITEANLLTHYGVRPVHTATEMQLLARRFPENIKLFITKRNAEILSGMVVFESQNVAHAQYIAATPEGRRLGALDATMDFLMNDIYLKKPHFDFGISTVEDGRTLNANLIRNKESYGARATVYDFYELNLET